jgi:hypothetical protein
MVINVSVPTPEADKLLDLLGLDADLTGCARVAAFDGRITYLNFPDADRRSGDQYLTGILHHHGHTSVTARAYASVLFAGISIEASMELVAGRAGRSARLTSSNTASQNDTLYCLRRGTPAQMAEQRRMIETVLALRAEIQAEAVGGQYAHNQLNLSNRAALLHIGMCVEDWHNLLRGRLQKQGNEPDVREAFARACLLLHDRFPYVIRTPVEYGYEEELP